MLKGHVFKEQRFGNQIFALFINTFLNGKNGIHNGYKNSMTMNINDTTITINSGVVCVQGRFLEEDTQTPIVVGTDTAFCKLVLEIDLDKQNTESEFNQASYKIIKGLSDYPELTQNDIINNNEGIYQYELARFKTNINGITEFQDKRTFLDFESIYAEIEKHIQDIDEGSIYALKEILNGTVLYENASGTRGNITLNDSIVNYDYIEIFYNLDNGVRGSIKSTTSQQNINVRFKTQFYESNKYSFRDEQINITIPVSINENELFLIIELIKDLLRITTGSSFLLKVKALRYVTFNELKEKKFNELKNYTFNELKGE